MTRCVETTSDDVVLCTSVLRRLDPNLRTPDVLNIAIAQRVSAQLLTFDAGMQASARASD